MSSKPIGILDSGFGGLSIYQSIRELLPQESTIYVGDHAHIPYGGKTRAYIRRRVNSIIQFLVKQNVKLVVVACNTGTIAGIDVYRKTFPGLPIIGVVPVVKTASENSQKKSFVVLSTTFTAKSPYQKNLIHSFAPECRVYNLGARNLVGLVEKGVLEGPDVAQELRAILKPEIIRDVDVIALGCTHYPFLKDAIRAIVGNDILIIDSGGAVARQVRRILDHNNLVNQNGKITHMFYSTEDNAKLSTVASKLLGEPVSITYAHI